MDRTLLSLYCFVKRTKTGTLEKPVRPKMRAQIKSHNVKAIIQAATKEAALRQFSERARPHYSSPKQRQE